MKLEFVESLALAHPFIKGFEQISYCINEEEVRSVAQGDISEAVAKRTKEDIEGKEDGSAVYSTTFYIGLAVEPKQRAFSLTSGDLRNRCAHALDRLRSGFCWYPKTGYFLSDYRIHEARQNVGEVRREQDGHCRSEYQEVAYIPKTSIATIHSPSSSNLPDYVFDEGERPPRLAQKRPKTEVRHCVSSWKSLVR